MNVRIKNLLKYPVRILIGFDEQGGGIYRVLEGYASYGPIEITEKTYASLKKDKRIMLTM